MQLLSGRRMASIVGIEEADTCDADDDVWEYRHWRRAKIVGVGDVVIYGTELRAGNCARCAR